MSGVPGTTTALARLVDIYGSALPWPAPTIKPVGTIGWLGSARNCKEGHKPSLYACSLSLCAWSLPPEPLLPATFETSQYCCWEPLPVMPKCFQKSQLKQVRGDLRCHLLLGAPGLAAHGIDATGRKVSSVLVTESCTRCFGHRRVRGAILSSRERRTWRTHVRYISDITLLLSE